MGRNPESRLFLAGATRRRHRSRGRRRVALFGSRTGGGRASFYVVQPEDLMIKPSANQIETIAGVGFRGSDNPLEGIEHLAGVTTVLRTLRKLRS